jgi:transposase
MTAGLPSHCKVSFSGSEQPVLYLALELGLESWKLAFGTGVGQAPRRREMPARDVSRLLLEIAEAKRRLRLPAACPVVSCYEAGRDGFWLHRCLLQHEVQNVIVDSSSIEVNRRARRAKSDSLDAEKLLVLLLRYAGGETKVWSVVNVPTPDEEDARQLHRELLALKQQGTEHVNRIKGLLAGLGLTIEINKQFPKKLAELQQWNNAPLPAALRTRLLREFERLQVVNRQVRELCRQRSKELREQESPALRQVQKLLTLKGIGLNSAWLYVQEFFGWRKFKNRKQVGSLAGLTPTPYASGQINHEQGISKAGNKRIRWMAVEIAWSWLHFQPQSELSQWYHRRFAQGSSRQRRIGIVALARKLLVQLWRYLETGVPPAGAELVDWRGKVSCTVTSLDAA